jgi:DNA-binding NtrC family response regulator
MHPNGLPWFPSAPFGIRTCAKLISTFFYDYHTVPIDLDRLLGTLGHAYGMAAIGQAPSRRGGADSSSHRLVGRSAAMRGVQRAIHKFATVEAPILITGESGTGKELLALQIHQRSQRAKGAVCADQLWGLTGYANPIGSS